MKNEVRLEYEQKVSAAIKSIAFQIPPVNTYTPQLVLCAQVVENLEAAYNEAINALKPFVALLQDHNRRLRGDLVIFEINGAQITVGDLRRAEQQIHRCEKE